MKKIKLIKLVILFIFVMCIFGLTETLFQDHIGMFKYSYPNTSYTLPENQMQAEMNDAMLSAAKENDVQFFYVDSQYVSDFDGIVNIYYSDEAVKECIAEKSLIKPGDYSTILDSNTVNFYSLSEIKKSEKNVNTYYLIGSSENINAFNVSLADSYGGAPIQKGYENEYDDFYEMLLLWAIVIAVFVLLTIYELQTNKKEIAVSISMGENPTKIFAKNVIADACGIAVSYITAMVAFDYFQIFGFDGKAILISVIGLFLADVGVFSSVFFMKIKSVFSGKTNSKALLGTSYFLKALTTVLTVLIISVSCAAIKQAADFYSQKDFFETYNYNFVGISCYDKDGQYDIQKENMLKAQLQKKLFKSNDALILDGGYSDKIGGRDFLLYNQNAGKYLFENIKDIKASELPKNKVILLAPQKYFKNGIKEEDVGEIKGLIDFIYDNNDGNYTFEYETIYYKDNAKLMNFAYENYGLSGYKVNPIVAYVNIDEAAEEQIKSPHATYSICNISSDEFQKLCSTYNDEFFNSGLEIKPMVRSAMDNYMHYRNLLQKTLVVGCFVSVMLILLEIILIYYVIKLEYIINAKELALKKIMGYSVFDRHKRLLLSTMIISAVGIIAALIINYSLKFSGVPYLLLGGILTAVIDIIVTVLFIIKTERTQLSKILKGGAL